MYVCNTCMHTCNTCNTYYVCTLCLEARGLVNMIIVVPVSICLQSQTVKEAFAHSQAGIPNVVQNRSLQRVGKFDYIVGPIFLHFSSVNTDEKDLPTLESYGSHFLHFVLSRVETQPCVFLAKLSSICNFLFIKKHELKRLDDKPWRPILPNIPTLRKIFICYTLSVCWSSARCVLCKVYFSEPNKLRPILNFKKYYPIEHIFVPACSSARKIHFFKF